jgi:glycosyltransferase involved in cell wall biosynthesis
MVYPKIILNMIVKNESSIIQQCLEQVLPLIDAYAIMDTGSSDTTIDIIKETLKDIPGRVETIEWSGFANARNAAISLAEGLGDYLLFVDADDKVELSVSPDKIREQLTEHVHPVMIRHHNTRYSRILFRSVKSKSSYSGVVHEALTYVPNEIYGALIQGITISYNAVGTSDRNKNGTAKYLQDAQLLEQAISEGSDPGTEARYQFYLAQSYRDYGDSEKALQAYKKRYEMQSGYSQERYVAAMNEGALYKNGLGSLADRLWAYQKAIEIDPARAEAPHAIAAMARENSMWNLAIYHARLAQSLPFPADKLFSDFEIYDWRATFEVSVAACYAGTKEEGLAACISLLENPAVPEHIKKLTTSNIKFYE